MLSSMRGAPVSIPASADVGSRHGGFKLSRAELEHEGDWRMHVQPVDPAFFAFLSAQSAAAARSSVKIVASSGASAPGVSRRSMMAVGTCIHLTGCELNAYLESLQPLSLDVPIRVNLTRGRPVEFAQAVELPAGVVGVSAGPVVEIPRFATHYYGPGTLIGDGGIEWGTVDPTIGFVPITQRVDINGWVGIVETATHIRAAVMTNFTADWSIPFRGFA